MRSPSAVFVFEIAIRPRIRHIADSSSVLSESPREDDLIRELAHSKLSDAEITGLQSWSIAAASKRCRLALNKTGGELNPETANPRD